VSDTFTRTVSGITNSHLFNSKRITVYTEGKLLKSKNINSEYSPDLRFWESVFDSFSDRSDFKFKCVGTKRNLIEIANKIVENGARNALVTMDRDHDDYRGKLLNSPYVLYTYGYSWENDVFGVESVIATSKYCYGQPNLPKGLVTKIRQCYKKFVEEISRLVKVHIKCNVSKVKFFDGRCGQVVRIDKNEYPKYDNNGFRQLVNKFNTNKKEKLVPFKISRINTWRSCYGKLCEFYGRNYFSWILINQLALADTVPVKMAFNTIISKFKSSPLECMSDLAINYYKKIFSRL